MRYVYFTKLLKDLDIRGVKPHHLDAHTGASRVLQLDQAPLADHDG